MWLSRMVYSVGSLERQGLQLDNFAYPIRTNKKESILKKKKKKGVRARAEWQFKFFYELFDVLLLACCQKETLFELGFWMI